MTSQRLESEGSNPSGPIADDGVQQPARADLAAGHTRLRPADAYAPGRDAGRFLKSERMFLLKN